jgi:hypothetical protein
VFKHLTVSIPIICKKNIIFAAHISETIVITGGNYTITPQNCAAAYDRIKAFQFNHIVIIVSVGLREWPV